MNGTLVDWDDAKIHVLTHTLHYGMGVFEGVRAYETPKGPAVFRLTEHMERLHNSAKILGMDMPYSVDVLVQATKDVVKASGLPSAYIRPIAYYGYGEMGLNTLPCSVDVAMALGRVPRRRRSHQRHQHQDLFVDSPRPQHDAACGQDHWQLREFVVGKGRSA
jgi:branched-subunit amino acid aminotransferase/4-amino-4-deoxychorismate lyase